MLRDGDGDRAGLRAAEAASKLFGEALVPMACLGEDGREPDLYLLSGMM